MTRKQEWIEEFIANVINTNPSEAKKIALQKATEQEILQGSVIDLWIPADALAKENSKPNLYDARLEAAEKFYDEYDFEEDFGTDATVECANGWHYDGKDTFTRSVFLDMGQDRESYSDTQDRDNYTTSTTKVTLRVIFEENSTVVDEYTVEE